jgi:hypothetical protein
MKAANMWGEGLGILIILDNSTCVLYEDPKIEISEHGIGWKHGTVQNGSIELSIDEARQLRESLDKEIKQYEQYDRDYASTAVPPSLRSGS